jgi:hypothetical protein
MRNLTAYLRGEKRTGTAPATFSRHMSNHDSGNAFKTQVTSEKLP